MRVLVLVVLVFGRDWRKWIVSLWSKLQWLPLSVLCLPQQIWTKLWQKWVRVILPYDIIQVGVMSEWSNLTCVPAACPCVHGQCDNRPDSDGRCKLDSCQKGFTGRFCDRQTAACGVQVQFCHAHADCDFSQRTPRWVYLHRSYSW